MHFQLNENLSCHFKKELGVIQQFRNAKFAYFFVSTYHMYALSQITMHLQYVLRNAPNFLDHILFCEKQHLSKVYI